MMLAVIAHTMAAESVDDVNDEVEHDRPMDER
jgi:hypothetical protein